MLTEMAKAGLRVVPLDEDRAVSRAAMLRHEGLGWPAIATVMRLYHGIEHGRTWWKTHVLFYSLDTAANRGRETAFRVDDEVMRILADCPLSLPQIHYRLGGNYDRARYSVARLFELGLISSDQTGAERRWHIIEREEGTDGRT